MKQNYCLTFLMILLLLPFTTISSQGFAKFPDFREYVSDTSVAQKVAKVSPNEDRNKGLLMYATSLRDYWKERGWYEIRENDTQNMTKIKTWNPGSGSYIDGLGCGSWGGDAYYAYRVLLYDMGYDYPDAFVKVDVKTGEQTVIKIFEENDDFRKNWNSYRFYDMTYNPVKDEIYALGQSTSENGQFSTLYKINKTDGSFVKLHDMGFVSYAMAVDMKGQLWIQTGRYEDGANIGDELLCMNTDDFSVIKEISLMYDEKTFKTYFYGSMSFDYTSGNLYWLAVNGAYGGYQNLFTVDLETGEMKSKGLVWGALIGLYIPYIIPENPAAPLAVSDLKAVPDASGKLESTLSWVNPTKQWNQEPLTELSAIKIYKKGTDSPVESISVTSANIGQEMTWTDKNAVAGINSYYVVPCSEKGGDGLKDSIEVYVGDDIPGKVQNITIENNTTSVTVSWTAPTVGKNGGYVSPENVTYKVVRYPDEKVIADNISETSVTDSEFIGQLCYRYSIQASNFSGTGDFEDSETFMAGDAHNVPVEFSFPDEMYSLAWTNLGGWSWSKGVKDGDERMITDILERPDNWLISPDIKLEAGKKYRIKSVIRTDIGPNSCSYDFKFAIGKGKTADAMTTILYEEELHRVSEYYYTETFENYFEPKESGVYNYGIEVTEIKGGDTFSFVGLTVEEVFDVDLAALEIKGVVDAIYNKDNTCSVIVYNNGDKAVSEYTVKIARVDAEGEYVSLGDTLVVSSLEPKASVEIPVTFVPDLEEDMQIVGFVDVEGDGNLYNNVTKAYSLTVLPEDMSGFNRLITNESTLDVYTRAPLSFLTTETMTQTIYLANELNVSCNSRIQRISYQYRGNGISSVLGPVYVKVYMCNTYKDVYKSSDEFIPVENMKLVYEGEVSVNPGEENSMTFFLSEDFIYANGMNLCIALTKSGNLGNSFPVEFKVFNESYNVTRTIVQDGSTINTWQVPVLQLAIVEDPDAVGVEKNISEESKIWYSDENSTLNFDGMEVTSVIIYDISGKMVENVSLSDINSVPVSLPAGIYVVRVADVNGAVRNIKINVAR